MCLSACVLQSVSHRAPANASLPQDRPGRRASGFRAAWASAGRPANPDPRAAAAPPDPRGRRATASTATRSRTSLSRGTRRARERLAPTRRRPRPGSSPSALLLELVDPQSSLPLDA